MADLACEYLLSSTLGNITFNDGTLGDGTDKYWISAIQGLDGPSVRAPVDLVPFGDGGILHTFRFGPRRVVFDGIILIESSTAQSECQALRNDMASQLEGITTFVAQDGGTLTWTPAGLVANTLDVFTEVGLSITYSDNYAVANFNFGLISAAANPTT